MDKKLWLATKLGLVRGYAMQGSRVLSVTYVFGIKKVAPRPFEVAKIGMHRLAEVES